MNTHSNNNRACRRTDVLVWHDEMTGGYVARHSGPANCEIIADGDERAWTVNEPWAAIFVALLTEHSAQNSACFFSCGSVRFEGVRARLLWKRIALRRCFPQ